MLKPLICFLIACGGLAVLSSSAWAADPGPPPSREDQHMHALVDGMRDASFWGHPDQFGRYKGLVAFSDGDYKHALYLFKFGARYADKVCQLSIGLMYLEGQGIPRDPGEAWAWISIAAERGYPTFVSTRDRVWHGLSADQRKRAGAIRRTLAKTYADKVARPRMIRELHYYGSQVTGSMLAIDHGVSQVAVGPSGTLSGACMRAARAGFRAAGCGGQNMYADENWNPALYFKARDAEYQGLVTVGALQAGGTRTSAANGGP